MQRNKDLEEKWDHTSAHFCLSHIVNAFISESHFINLYK